MLIQLLDLLKWGWVAVKFLAVAILFYRFLRQSTVIAGIGLMTITSAVLLDAAANILTLTILQESLGFLAPVLQGGLFAGAAIWLWGTLRPSVLAEIGQLVDGQGGVGKKVMPALVTHQATDEHAEAARIHTSKTQHINYDRQMLFDQIRTRLGREDIFDLIFDMGLNENDVVGLEGDMNQVIVRLMNMVEEEGLTNELSLAVERILVPLEAEDLPRVERLSVETPPTLLRQFLLTAYKLETLVQMAHELEIDWEQLGMGSKKEKVRELLLYLYRRNRLEELIQLMQTQVPA